MPARARVWQSDESRVVRWAAEGRMFIRSAKLWVHAFAFVLVAACGDDDEEPVRGGPPEDGSQQPGPDEGDAAPRPPDGGGPVIDHGGHDMEVDASIIIGGDPSPDGGAPEGGAMCGSEDGGPPLDTPTLSSTCFLTGAELAQHGGGTADEITAAFTLAGVDTSARRAELIFPHTCGVAQNCELEDPDPSCAMGFVSEYLEGVKACYDSACLDATLDSYACAGAAKSCECLDACEPLVERQLDACAKYQQ
jgi:hypothetical protein